MIVALGRLPGQQTAVHSLTVHAVDPVAQNQAQQ